MLISVTMALESLTEQVEVVTDREASLTRERAIRDNLIRDAVAAGVKYRPLMKITGLSRDRLWTIANQPYQHV